MTAIITQVFDRSYLGVLPFERWRVVRTEEGRYRAEEWIDRNRMSDAECTEYDREEEQWANIPEGMYDGPPPPTFPTEALAVEWAGLQDAHVSTEADLHAFGAPSECYRDAYRGLERREQEFWAEVEAAEGGFEA